MGCHFLLQGIFPTQGWTPGLPHCRQMLYCLNHQGSPQTHDKIVQQPWLLLLLSRFSRVRLCDPIDGSPPGCPVPGILQARTLEWVAISFSNA